MYCNEIFKINMTLIQCNLTIIKKKSLGIKMIIKSFFFQFILPGFKLQKGHN